LNCFRRGDLGIFLFRKNFFFIEGVRKFMKKFLTVLLLSLYSLSTAQNEATKELSERIQVNQDKIGDLYDIVKQIKNAENQKEEQKKVKELEEAFQELSQKILKGKENQEEQQKNLYVLIELEKKVQEMKVELLRKNHTFLTKNDFYLLYLLPLLLILVLILVAFQRRKSRSHKNDEMPTATGNGDDKASETFYSEALEDDTEEEDVCITVISTGIPTKSFNEGAYLVSDNNPSNGDKVIFRNGKNTVGRRSRNTISLKWEGVSKEHACFIFDENTLFIKDLNSTNGTWLQKQGQGSFRKLHANTKYAVESLDVVAFGRIPKNQRGKDTTSIFPERYIISFIRPV
jgi:TolA-binding protein